MRGLLKNKKILHLGVEKGLIFFNGWKDIFKILYFFKIRVYEMTKKWWIDEGIKIFGCQNSKNSSLYNGEEEFIKIIVLKI